MVPFVRSSNGSLELYYSARDHHGQSHTAVADFDLTADGRAHVVPRAHPILSPGALGGFDDSGAMGSCVVDAGNGDLYLYYIGWSLGVSVPFATYIGLAISRDGGHTYDRISDGPVVGRSRDQPYLATSPWVMRDQGHWRLWYSNGVRWEATPAGPKHYYRIEHATSTDGIVWRNSGNICIDFADASEYAIARPSVVRDDDAYRMWFSHRGPAYRISQAESQDGLTWARQERIGELLPDGNGWESQSVEYGCVFDHAGARWMLYNGDDYGRAGIGLAVLSHPS